MKYSFTLFLLAFFLQAGYGQLNTFPAQGAGTIIRTASGIGNGILQAKAAQERNRQREQLEEEYFGLVANADTLYGQKRYEEAIAMYNDALTRKQEQYPKDQIAKARTELARQQQQADRLMTDRADSLYDQLQYEQAIALYNEVLTNRPQDPYPKDRIAKANEGIARRRQVHFSGLLISDVRIDDTSSKAGADDPYSDFLPAGKYGWMDQMLTYANFRTLDGIAVPPGVRLIVYGEKQLKGSVLLDVTGPVIVNNGVLQNAAGSAEMQTKAYVPALQQTYPPSVRTWSTSDMRTWVNGSMEIIAP